MSGSRDTERDLFLSRHDKTTERERRDLHEIGNDGHSAVAGSMTLFFTLGIPLQWSKASIAERQL